MTDKTEIEARIVELEADLGHALYPVTREQYVSGMLSVSDEVAKLQNIDMEWRRNNPERLWLSFLETVKSEKDRDSEVWKKMQRWD